MNRLTAFCFFVCLLTTAIPFKAISQQAGLIYLQTENNQYYEVDWSGKTFKSSSTGYLAIPQVPAGNHSFTFRFDSEADGVYEYAVLITMTDQSRSFSLRQATDNSWSLFDLVDYNLIKGNLVVQVIVREEPIKKTPRVLPVIYPEKETVQKATAKKGEPLVIKPETVIKKEKPIVIIPSNILKIFDKSSSSGVDQVYVLLNGARLDTIALFIPVIEVDTAKTGTNPSAGARRSENEMQKTAFGNRSNEMNLTRQRYIVSSK